MAERLTLRCPTLDRRSIRSGLPLSAAVLSAEVSTMLEIDPHLPAASRARGSTRGYSRASARRLGRNHAPSQLCRKCAPPLVGGLQYVRCRIACA